MAEPLAKPLMNYRRGLFRAWMVLLVIWSAVILVVALDKQHRLGVGGQDPIMAEYRWSWWFWTDWIEAIFTPWVLTGVGLGLRWTARGFRSN